MGVCGSNNNLTPEEQSRRKLEKDRSKQLEAQMSNDHSVDQQVNKLLLLGAGESGKLTLFIHSILNNKCFLDILLTSVLCVFVLFYSVR
jgi:hypothetical protein